MMVVPEGIRVVLTVSTVVKQTTVPDVTNKQYQEATIELQNAGFLVEIAKTEASDSVTTDYVISTDPAPGEELAEGSTVFLTVSAGPSIKVATMPNLVGLEERMRSRALRAPTSATAIRPMSTAITTRYGHPPEHRGL